MVTKIKRWGNSLALRIPKELARETGLADNTVVDVKVKGGKLVISTPPQETPSLDELLAKVTPDNVHQEIDTGPSVGDEQW